MDNTGSRELAAHLARAIQRLRARIRAESGLGASPWTRSQLLVLDRIVAGPPQTTSDLAAAEYVRPQSMATTLAPLEEAGLIERRRDPHDGRRMFVVATDAGQDLLRSLQDRRDEWLASAIESELDDGELSALPMLVGLLDRLTDCEVHSRTRGRHPLRVMR